MSAKGTYSPQQVSEMLDISPATLRRYSRQYTDHLSEGARKTSKSRRYTDTDILVLKKIRQLTRDKRPPAEIAQLIQIVDEPQEEQSSLALLPAVLQEFENLRNRLTQQDERITSQNEQLDELRRRLDELANKTPWYKRLFKRDT